jgi:hypothetical protein
MPDWGYQALVRGRVVAQAEDRIGGVEQMSGCNEMLVAARAEALFTSPLSACRWPSREEVAAAVRQAVLAYGGSRGCASEVAAEYGDHPDTAAARMRWARAAVEAVYAVPRRASMEACFGGGPWMTTANAPSR